MAVEEERKIPVLTVTKNGAILKNIFVVNNQSEEENGDDDEEILTVGRHPDCHIMLTHPSISRFHLQIHSKPSSQKLFVIDLASVHGTWVSEKKLEPRVPVELNEGDTIRVGGSTRMYRLHWVPLSQAYDMETPFVESKQVEDGLLEESETNQDENSVSIEIGKNEVKDSLAVKGKEEQTCQDLSSLSINIKHTEVEESLVVDRKEVKDQDDNPGTVQNKAIQSLDLILDGIVSLFSDGNCFLSSGIESGDLSVPVREAILESKEQQFAKDYQMPWHCSMTEVISEKEKPGSFLGSEEKYEVSANLFASPSDVEEVRIVEGSKDESLLEKDDEMRDDNSKSWSESFVKESVNLSLVLGEVFSEIDTEQVDKGNQTLQSLTGLQLLSENENKENLPSLVIGEDFLKTGSEQVDKENQTLQPVTGLLPLPENENQENLPSLVLSEDFSKINSERVDKENQTLKPVTGLQPLSENENQENLPSWVLGEDFSKINNSEQVDEENQTLQSLTGLHLLSENENKENLSSLMLGEDFLKIDSEQVDKENQTLQPLTGLRSLSENENQENFPADQNLDLLVNLNTTRVVEDGRPAVELFVEADQNLSRKDHEEMEMPNSGSVLEAESVNSSLPVGEVFSEINDNKESQTPQSFYAPMVLYQPENLESSQTRSDKRPSSNSVWSRRGKPASVLQIQTGRSKGKKTIKDLENAEVEFQDMGDIENRSVSRALFSSLDEMEEEAYTPNKENYSPNTLLLKSYKRMGKLEEIKHSRSARSSFINVALSPSILLEEDLSGISDRENQMPKVLREPEAYTPNKENYSPNTLLLKSYKRMGKLEEIKHSRSARSSSINVALSPSILLEEDLSGISDRENQMRKVLREQKPARRTSRNQVKLEQERSAMKKKTERLPFQSLLENSAGKSKSHSSVANATASSHSIYHTQPMEKVINSSSSVGEGRRSWTMVVDTATLLDKESRNSLQLLQGLKGTQLIIPRMVIRELDCLKRRGGLFRRTTEITSVLEWIEECMVKTEWWIHIQSSAELIPVAPTPPASPQSRNSDGSTSWGAFASHSSLTEIISPTAEDHILDYALLYRKMNGGQLVLLSNDVTLKIKAMAEGLICETAQEFRESLVNPFSERFMWADSSPRGLTWSHLDDVVLRERYSRCPFKKPSKGGDGAKGLKLILLHNSNYAHISSVR